jgi:hypothetical protein
MHTRTLSLFRATALGALVALFAGVVPTFAADAPAAAPTVAEAEQFMAEAEARLLKLYIARDRAQWVRPRQVLPAGEAHRMPGHRAALDDPHDQPRPEGARDGLGGLAFDLPADARQVSALRRARQQGRQGDRLRRPGRALALGLRHAARRLRRRSSTACGPGQAALRRRCTATCARAHPRSTGQGVVRPDGRIPAHLLGNMWAQQWGNIYDLVEPPERRSRARSTSPPAEGEEGRRARHGQATARASSRRSGSRRCPRPSGSGRCSPSPRPRRRLPRQRLGHRPEGRPAHQDVHRDQRGGLRHDPPRARAQLLPARLQHAADALPDGANDGFHEAIGDTVALSVTPEYLKSKVGLIEDGAVGGGRHRRC